MKIRSFAALALLAVVPAACTAMSTYPPVDGKVINTPSVSPGPEVMAGAIKEAHRLTAPGTDIIFNLPAGLPENTWNRVVFLLPESARAMEPGDEGVYSIKQLRIQGGTAEVDVLYPDRGVYQLMTVKFNGGPLAPWTIAWTRVVAQWSTGMRPSYPGFWATIAVASSIETLAAAITPVPGGVGPMTVTLLLVNTVASWCQRCGLDQPLADLLP